MLLLLTAWCKRPGEGPINKTKSMRRELSAILQEHNDGQLMKDVQGKASGKLIKTKTASGLSLPRMVLPRTKARLVEKKDQQSSLKARYSVDRRHYGDDNLMGDDWRDKPYFPPSIKIANEWKSENIYRGGKANPCTFNPKYLAELGPGVRLYFYIIDVQWQIPSLIFCSAAMRDALKEKDFTKPSTQHK